jgi:hypothetical protein
MDHLPEGHASPIDVALGSLAALALFTVIGLLAFAV